jgi:hypothetical protein
MRRGPSNIRGISSNIRGGVFDIREVSNIERRMIGGIIDISIRCIINTFISVSVGVSMSTHISINIEDYLWDLRLASMSMCLLLRVDVHGTAAGVDVQWVCGWRLCRRKSVSVLISV